MTEETKKWYKSKTIWVNLVMIIALVVQTQVGFAINAEEQIAVVAIINLGLRAITSSGLE